MITIDLNTIDWKYGYGEPGSDYDWATAQAFIPIDEDFNGWLLYIGVNTETENAKLTAIACNDAIHYDVYSSDSTQHWPMLDELFGGRENWQSFCNDYAKKAMKQYREENQEED